MFNLNYLAISNLGQWLPRTRRLAVFLACLVMATPALAHKDLASDRDAARLARAEAWRAEMEAKLAEGADRAPALVNADKSSLALELGGDDLLIERHESLAIPRLEITTAGIIYVAVTRESVDYGWEDQTINIYRSDDGGRSFDLWSVFTDPGPDQINYVSDFLIAEGVSDRAFLTYNVDSSPRTIRVAWVDLGAGTPIWNHVTALSAAGSAFRRGDAAIATDAADFDDYYLYLVSAASAGFNRDIWFARSTDYGATWEPAYKVVENIPGTEWDLGPALAYGAGDFLHLIYSMPSPAGSGGDGSIHHVRAESFADLGVGSWSAPSELDANTNGFSTKLLDIEGSLTDGTVLVHLDRGRDGDAQDNILKWSTDYGATWPAANEAQLDVDSSHRGDIDLDEAGNVWVLGHTLVGTAPEVTIRSQRSSLAAPGAFSAPERWSAQQFNGFGALYDLEHDPSRGNQRAVVWAGSKDGAFNVYFDAQWRRDPGWPNTEMGFPLALNGIGRTPPAIADVDDDPYGEIVFATEEGSVYVVNHDGSVADGWPVDLGVSIPWDAPVAVGDLNGDDALEIVVGTDDGQVFAFNPDGSLSPGWPVDLGTAAGTYVSIGALGPPYPRYVVACSDRRTVVLNYAGADLSPSWGTAVEELLVPAAIGDVDNDGIAEIITRQSTFISVKRLDQNTQVTFRAFVGETLTSMPALADIDGDGDLEIAVGTSEGRVHLMHHDMSDFNAGYPYDNGNVSPVTGVVAVDINGSDAPELVFSQLDGTTHVVYGGGSPAPGFPTFTGPLEDVYMPPVVANVHASTPNLLVSAGNRLHSWGQFSFVPDGWPHLLGDYIEESVAVGDIDLDGNVEIVALGLSRLTVLDVGNPFNPVAHRTWPMYGYNAQRTGCLNCSEDAVSAVDDALVAAPTRLAFAPPFPNPTSSRTALSYALPQAAQVKLQIFDVRGRLVRTLADGQQEAGTYEMFWNGKAANGRRVALGLYLAKLAINGPDGAEQRVRKISLVR